MGGGDGGEDAVGRRVEALPASCSEGALAVIAPALLLVVVVLARIHLERLDGMQLVGVAVLLGDVRALKAEAKQAGTTEQPGLPARVVSRLRGRRSPSR